MTTNDQPSQTALTAAAARAAHLIVDDPPPIFADPMAITLLGDHADDFIGYHRNHGTHLVLSTARGQVTSRSRYTEDRLARAVRNGINQYVILGAGLDSFAYRSPLARSPLARSAPAQESPAGSAAPLRVFEVDHPATQQWKREQLAAVRITPPPSVHFVALDLEKDELTRCLIGCGFDPTRPAFVSWLGVTMYLTEPAIGRTLAEVGSFCQGTELIADYMLPADLRDEAGNSYAEQVMPVAAERGEPWLTFLSPHQASTLLDRHGFSQVRHATQRNIGDATTWDRTDSLRPIALSMLAHATVTGR